MEDALTYIIVFGLLIGGFAFWQFRYSKPRPYLLSQQIFPELDLYLLIEKTEGKTKVFIVKIKPKTNIETTPPFVELIDKNRNIQIMELNTILKDRTAHTNNGLTISYKYSFNEFNKLLKSSDFKFKTFRLVIVNKNGEKYKSHELAFNKTWTLYRPDGGKYN